MIGMRRSSRRSKQRMIIPAIRPASSPCPSSSPSPGDVETNGGVDDPVLNTGCVREQEKGLVITLFSQTPANSFFNLVTPSAHLGDVLKGLGEEKQAWQWGCVHDWSVLTDHQLVRYLAREQQDPSCFVKITVGPSRYVSNAKGHFVARPDELRNETRPKTSGYHLVLVDKK